MRVERDVLSVQMTIVRPAQLRDCAVMAELAGQLGYECTGEEVRKRLRDMRDPTQYAVFVAEGPAAQIAGWIGAYLFRSIETDVCAEINGLVVDERIRSQGIGKKLLQSAEQWARSIGCNAISVRSNIKRERAHHFYLSNGYEQVKTQKEFRKSL